MVVNWTYIIKIHALNFIELKTKRKKSVLLYDKFKAALKARLYTVWFHLYDIIEKATPSQQKTDQWLPGIRGKKRLTQRGIRQFPLGEKDLLYILIIVVNILLCFSKLREYKKRVNFIVNKLYFNKSKYSWFLKIPVGCAIEKKILSFKYTYLKPEQNKVSISTIKRKTK